MAEEVDLPRLAARLKAFRQRLGVSQYELADRTRPGDRAHSKPMVSASTIGMIEMGRRGATLPKIDALAIALELDDDEHQELRDAAGHGDTGSDPLGVIGRLDTLEDALDAINSRLDDLENHLDDLGRRLP